MIKDIFNMLVIVISLVFFLFAVFTFSVGAFSAKEVKQEYETPIIYNQIKVDYMVFWEFNTDSGLHCLANEDAIWCERK